MKYIIWQNLSLYDATSCNTIQSFFTRCRKDPPTKSTHQKRAHSINILISVSLVKRWIIQIFNKLSVLTEYQGLREYLFFNEIMSYC